MRFKKCGIVILMLLFTTVFVSGCNREQYTVFKAALKMNDIQSMQEHGEITLNLDADGLSPTYESNFLVAKSYLNDAVLSTETKMITNEDRTLTKTQVDANLAAMDTNISFSAWIDSDLTDKQPKMTEIFKLPASFSAYLPPEFAGKEYMVYKPMEVAEDQGISMNYTDIIKASKDIEEKYISFLKKYAVQYNPAFIVKNTQQQVLQTKDGQKTGVWYEIQLDDQEFKQLIRYTVNHFMKSDDATAFIKDIMMTSLDIAQIPDQEKAKLELEEAFKSYSENSNQFLSEFNHFIDSMADVGIIGEKGINLKFFIADGYIIKQTGYIDLNLDLESLAHLAADLNDIKEEIPEDIKGTIKIGIGFSSEVYDINKDIDINFPEINDQNSIDYMKLLTSVKE